MNKFIHLTNDAVQKYSEEYGKYEPANKVSFQEFDKYLKREFKYDHFYSQILANMKGLTKILFEVGNLMIGRSCHQF
jgi:tubulin--tyrosine ligase